MSKNVGMGKSHVIYNQYKKYENISKLNHISFNGENVDFDLLIKSLSKYRHDYETTIIFHINLSASTFIHINTILFQIMFLRHMVTSSHRCFHANNNTVFLVEIPSKLSNTAMLTDKKYSKHEHVHFLLYKLTNIPNITIDKFEMNS